MLGFVVLEAEPAGTAQAHPVDEAGVYQFVGQDEVALPRDGGKDTGVGIKAAVEHEGRLCAIEACQGHFKFVESGMVSRQQPGRGGRRQEVFGRQAFQEAGTKFHVCGQSQVVVGREVEHPLSCCMQVTSFVQGMGQGAEIALGGQFVQGGLHIDIWIFHC